MKEQAKMAKPVSKIASVVVIGGVIGLFALIYIMNPNAGGGSHKKENSYTKSSSSKIKAGVTYKNFERVRIGMTLSDVTSILGNNYKLVGESQVGKTYRWSTGLVTKKYVDILFMYGKVDGKGHSL